MNNINFARRLKNQQTLAEEKLWRMLRNRRFCNLKFRRQHPIGPYIVDFYCAKKRAIVEIDGAQHGRDQKYDENRTNFLNGQGYYVLRFWNHEVLNQQKAVLEKIRLLLMEKSF